MNYIIYILYLLFTVSGITFMKLGGDSLNITTKDIFSFKIGYVTLLGFICYIVSFILWQKIIVTSNISIIVPVLTGIVQVAVVVIALVIFKEKVTIFNVIGIILIIAGVVLLGIKR